MVFAKMVRGRGMTLAQIRPWFNKLVDKSDWEGTPKDQILHWLSLLSADKSGKIGG